MNEKKRELIDKIQAIKKQTSTLVNQIKELRQRQERRQKQEHYYIVYAVNSHTCGVRHYGLFNSYDEAIAQEKEAFEKCTMKRSWIWHTEKIAKPG